MVASDTVVGLVGAGILLVALVGVFVYESQQGQGSDAELKNANYVVSSTGTTYQNVQGTGQQVPQANQCVNNPPTQPCTVQGAQVEVKLTGLPSPGNLHYVVFIDGSPDTRAVGEATASGQTYAIGSKKVNGNFGANPKLSVCLESSGSATSCTWKIASYAVSGSTVAPTADAMFISGSGNHTVSFTASGSNTNVNARLDNLQNKTGYTYRGWMVKDTDSGRNYTFVGNFTPDAGSTGNEMDGSITGSFAGKRLDFNRFIVTIEPQSASIGIKPAGPAVIVADYNAVATPSAQK
jgi:hypothetical protein